MRFSARRSGLVLLVSLIALVIAALFTTPGVSAARSPRKVQPTPEPPACPNRQLPPAPVDTSEEPPPGSPSPEPLPVPEEPVGGPRMGECGLVQPAGAGDPPANITAASWVISDLDSGAVLAAKDPHARERPASLIKVLLAIIVIRELRQDTVVIGTQEDANQEGTKVGIGPGGEYTVRQLLFALIMRSGNDAAHALARALGGVPVALDKMNALAKELGALDTRAATPSGLDGPGMTTSAYDQSVIFRTAMRHKEFAEAAITRQIDFPGYRGKAAFKVTNDNRLLRSYQGFLGGKTGFTDDARHTYVGAAKRGDQRLAVVLLRGERDGNEPLGDQGARLLDYGFTLASQRARPVGQLVERAPEAQPKGEVSRDDSAAATPVGDPAAPAPEATDGSRTAFGTVGLPLVGFAAVAAVISLMLWFRRRRARAAAAARSRPEAALATASAAPEDAD